MLFLFKRSVAESILLGMAACFVNHVFFILPIATIIYGDQAVLPITVLIVIDTSVVFGGVIIGLEIAKHRQASFWKTTKRLIFNPVLMAIFIGFLAKVTDLQLHEGIYTYISFVGRAAPPASRFSLGVILALTCTMSLDINALCVVCLKIIIFH